MLKNPTVKNILSILAVTALGFLLLNLTFILDWVFQSLLGRFLLRDNPQMQWLAAGKHILFLILIVLLSFWVLKSKWNRLFKAAFFMVPVAAALVTVGMFFSRWPFLLYGAGILIYAGVMFYLFQTKRNWLYYYSASIVAASLFLMNILGIDI